LFHALDRGINEVIRMSRRGFTLAETMVAIGMLSAALVLVAQLAAFGLTERRRNVLRQEALEAAANVLESAQATPWDGLTPAWAAQQKLPEALAQRLPHGKLIARVEEEGSEPRTKRVTVEIDWQRDDTLPAAPVQLVGLFGKRSLPRNGGEP